MSLKYGQKLDLTLLYAEDETITRSVLCEVLSTKIRTVYQASNGKEGLEMFRRCRPDVVLIDNNMPEMDGVSMARAIRALDSAVRIIIVSGDIKRNTLSDMEEMKLHYMKKPLRVRELIDLLQNLLNGQELPAHLSARSLSMTSR